jgi:hypothetical protein
VCPILGPADVIKCEQDATTAKIAATMRWGKVRQVLKIQGDENEVVTAPYLSPCFLAFITQHMISINCESQRGINLIQLFLQEVLSIFSLDMFVLDCYLNDL